MLLVHQIGSVKIGEVVRYTLTYTPAHDRILPTPSHLCLRIKNSSAIPLRAAYLHGPYTLYAASYPSVYDPNTKYEGGSNFGNPQFEPQLKAGSSWNAQLKIPDEIRESVGHTHGDKDTSAPSVTWIIEVAAQILFSMSASVHYELVVGRDEKSIDFGFAGLMNSSSSVPGHLSDHQKHSKGSHGIYSKAISLDVEDTAKLWNKPELPHYKDEDGEPIVNPVLVEPDPKHTKPEQSLADVSKYSDSSKSEPTIKKRIHLVVITHGLHSNLGADMLYLKESIDLAAKQARLDKQMRRAKRASRMSSQAASRDSTGKPESQDKEVQVESEPSDPEPTDSHSKTEKLAEGDEDDDEISEDEEVIVRGFAGNATRTERGIQYLGKRLAKYVLSVTYPDQPYLPLKKVKSPLVRAFTSNDKSEDPHAAHHRSSIKKEETSTENLAYQITSISFIGHSLGGLTQTYAIAYIHKHSPEFFSKIRPVNFVALASPFLGLSNENPLYVKFALDFGLVGRTGQDLGLTWRAPTLARNGWSAMIAGIGNEGQRRAKQPDPGSKPLLRILPAGPAHQVLRLFKNRTVYSNVVNDGVVPLRTSCLLFLDWRGLGRVEKARRAHGVTGTIGSLANWGWAELTGANASEYQKFKFWFDNDSTEDPELAGSMTPASGDESRQVPQPSETAIEEDQDITDAKAPEPQQFLSPKLAEKPTDAKNAEAGPQSTNQGSSPLAGFLSLFRSGPGSSKTKKIYRRGQTTDLKSDDESTPGSPMEADQRPNMARGDSALQDPSNLFTPPSTSIFESATDILNPPIPTLEYLVDPSQRPRTIFHDRVYHPDDIPPPPPKKRFSMRRNQSVDAGKELSASRQSTMSIESGSSVASNDTGNMKVEEKIARAYHRELSWRKVLVRLEPDAHNNIVVRRMFANAYGWPVVKHLVDTHFADSFTARTADIDEAAIERAKPMNQRADSDGDEVSSRPATRHRRASTGAHPESRDSVSNLQDATTTHSGKARMHVSRMDSAVWDDRYFNSDSSDDEDEFTPQRSPELSPSIQRARTPDIIQHNLDSKLGMRPAPIDTSQPVVASKLTASPKSTTSLGLQKCLQEQMKVTDEVKSAEQKLS